MIQKETGLVPWRSYITSFNYYTPSGEASCIEIRTFTPLFLMPPDTSMENIVFVFKLLSDIVVCIEPTVGITNDFLIRVDGGMSRVYSNPIIPAKNYIEYLLLDRENINNRDKLSEECRLHRASCIYLGDSSIPLSRLKGIEAAYFSLHYDIMNNYDAIIAVYSKTIRINIIEAIQEPFYFLEAISRKIIKMLRNSQKLFECIKKIYISTTAIPLYLLMPQGILLVSEDEKDLTNALNILLSCDKTMKLGISNIVLSTLQ